MGHPLGNKLTLPAFLLGRFLVKSGYQVFPYKPQFFGCDRFDHHALKFSLKDRAQITPVRIEDFRVLSF